MPRLRPQAMCKKHPGIPAVRETHLCQSCLTMKRFGEATMGKVAAGGAKK
jgi:hypothetical protein